MRWTLVTTIIRRVISLLLFLVIAGWLSQTDFGIFRSYSLILLLLTSIGTLGLDFHYITSDRNTNLNLLSLSQFGIILWLALSLVSIFMASLIGNIYHSPQLGWLMLATFPILGIELLRTILRAQAQKSLMFRELALAETLNVLLYSALALVGLFFIRKVWLYVGLFYLGNLAEALFLKRALPPLAHGIKRRMLCPKCLKYSLAVLKQNLSFLSNVLAINVLQIYAGNAPVLFLGMLAEPARMGLYFFATQMIGVPVGMLTGAVSQVFFPVFAVQQRSVTIANIRRYTSLILWLGIPLLICYAFGLQYLIPLFLGDKWNAALPLIYYLVLFYGTSLLHHPISAVPVICRKPHYELIWNVISTILRLAALAWGFRYGYDYAVLSFCLASAVLHLSFYFMSLVLLGEKLVSSIVSLMSRLLIPAILGLSVIRLGGLRHGLYYGTTLLIVYFGILYLIDPGVYSDLKRLLLPAKNPDPAS
ncbi:MAG TPA: oligosaccharide flippase family protein [Candidatus Cloacimonadota bacterium]|nr:oligosaccharide flippase family protein [Candidatus Cloacimonadota bacterium]